MKKYQKKSKKTSEMRGLFGIWYGVLSKFREENEAGFKELIAEIEYDDNMKSKLEN